MLESRLANELYRIASFLRGSRRETLGRAMKRHMMLPFFGQIAIFDFGQRELLQRWNIVFKFSKFCCGLLTSKWQHFAGATDCILLLDFLFDDFVR